MMKFALFVFNGDPMCFIHVLLNALDMKAKGHAPSVIIEGAAVKLIPDLVKEDHPLNKLWGKVKDAGLVDGVCRACSNKLGTLQAAKDQGLTLLDDMSGHPSLSGYQEQGYEIITF
ncbi:MAG: DsrE family protein [Desulfobacteraceae bacterium]|nr:DsrE family protein [Desulfobacteraceae bacterium]MBC2757228.1 DsrE family protein [Desulfobacteraceae bacterium]